MNNLADIIYCYRSASFNAAESSVTKREALTMAHLLMERLCHVLREGGTLRCDGDVLADLLDDVRTKTITAFL